MRAKEFITEHKVVFRRNPKTGQVKMVWRCTSGVRTGRTVPTAADCNASYDIGKAQTMKKTRARTGKNQAWKAQLTKSRSKGSRVAKKLNAWFNKRRAKK